MLPVNSLTVLPPEVMATFVWSTKVPAGIFILFRAFLRAISNNFCLSIFSSEFLKQYNFELLPYSLTFKLLTLTNSFGHIMF